MYVYSTMTKVPGLWQKCRRGLKRTTTIRVGNTGRKIRAMTRWPQGVLVIRETKKQTIKQTKGNTKQSENKGDNSASEIGTEAGVT